jgi:hypothetical protein
MTHVLTMILTVVAVMVLLGVYGIEWKRNRNNNNK